MIIVIRSPYLTGDRMERIPEWALGVELGRLPTLSSVWLAVLVNQQVWCSSTSVRGDGHKETRERGRLQWARWPSAWDWRIDLSPKSNLEDGHNPGLMIAGRVSRRHWCDKEAGGVTACALSPLCCLADCRLFLGSKTSGDMLVKPERAQMEWLKKII